MRTTRFVFHCLVSILALATVVQAQSTPEVNRKLTDLSLTPGSAGGGTYDLYIPVEILVSNPGTLMDVSTTLEVSVNGLSLGPPRVWPLQSNDPTASCSLDCGSNCGPLYVDGVLNTMTCHEDQPADCSCGHWFASEYPGVPLSPGDEIVVILYPPPGAFPDSNSGDDFLSHTFTGDPTGWNRRVAGIGLDPSPVADSFFDIIIWVDFHASGTTAPLNVSTEVEARINGVPLTSTLGWEMHLDGSPGDCPLDCGSSCGGIYVDGVLNTMTCHEDQPGDCSCGHWIQASIPGVELQPGDEIMVLLRPAPGAIPDPDESDDILVETFTGRQIGWGREVYAVSIAPTGSKDSFFDITVDAALRFESSAPAGMDLSTEMQLIVGSVPVGTVQAWSLQPAGPAVDCESACGSGCGGLYVDGVLNTLTCRKDGPDDCDCGHWIQAHFPGVDLQPGDEITVLLRPAPGAAPDADGSPDGDIFQKTFDGQASGRNRSLYSVQMVEVSPGVFDLRADGAVTVAGDHPFADLSFEARLEIDGAVVATETVTMEYQPDHASPICEEDCSGGDCGQYHNGNQDQIAGLCLIWPGFSGCSCGASFDVLFPAIPIPPGPPIKVQLVPVPGALPELPGFPEDDEGEPELVTDAGHRATPDRAIVLEQNQPNPFNPQTSISFRTGRAGPVRLQIFDTRGALVRQLVNEVLAAGTYTVQWDGRNDRGTAASSGHYYYRLQFDDKQQTRKMTLLK